MPNKSINLSNPHQSLKKHYIDQTKRASIAENQHPNMVVQRQDDERYYFVYDGKSNQWTWQTDLDAFGGNLVHDQQKIAGLNQMRQQRLKELDPNHVEWSKFGIVKDEYAYDEKSQQWYSANYSVKGSPFVMRVNHPEIIRELNQIREARLEIINDTQKNVLGSCQQASTINNKHEHDAVTINANAALHDIVRAQQSGELLDNPSIDHKASKAIL